MLTVSMYASAQIATNTDEEALQAMADEVVALVNQERAKKNLQPLTQLPEMTRCAAIRSRELIKKYSHTRPDGRDCCTVIEHLLHRGCGENIASGQKLPAQVMNGWMHSPGHRANILTEDYTHIGVGVCRNSKGSYDWVQLFIKTNEYFPDAEYFERSDKELRALSDKVVTAINKVRIAKKLNPLRCSPTLDAAAAEANIADIEMETKGKTKKRTNVFDIISDSGANMTGKAAHTGYQGNYNPSRVVQRQLDEYAQFVLTTDDNVHIAVDVHFTNLGSFHVYWSIVYYSCSDLGDEYVLK